MKQLYKAELICWKKESGLFIPSNQLCQLSPSAKVSKQNVLPEEMIYKTDKWNSTFLAEKVPFFKQFWTLLLSCLKNIPFKHKYHLLQKWQKTPEAYV